MVLGRVKFISSEERFLSLRLGPNLQLSGDWLDAPTSEVTETKIGSEGTGSTWAYVLPRRQTRYFNNVDERNMRQMHVLHNIYRMQLIYSCQGLRILGKLFYLRQKEHVCSTWKKSETFSTLVP